MKRFYTSVSLSDKPPYEVLLDGKPIRTPLKKKLVIPSEALAQAILKEWDSVEDNIHAESMPITQLFSTALDKIDGCETDIIEQLIGYVHGDAILYMNPDDALLYQKQQQLWQPLINAMSTIIKTPYQIQEGLMPSDQDEAIVSFWTSYLENLNIYELNGFQVSVSLTSSPILAYHLYTKEKNAQEIFNLALLEELHQNELWGCDTEAAKVQQKKQQELTDLAFYLDNLN